MFYIMKKIAHIQDNRKLTSSNLKKKVVPFKEVTERRSCADKGDGNSDGGSQEGN